MKFLVNVLFPLTLLCIWVAFAAYHLPAYDHEVIKGGLLFLPLIILTVLTAISISIYLVDLIKPGFFSFDFRSWRPISYSQFEAFDKKGSWKVPGGKGLRTVYLLFPVVFFIATLYITSTLSNRMVGKELDRYGVTTRAIIIDYFITHHKGTSQNITVQFKVNTGRIRESKITVHREYRIGDSVLIEYFSKRPAICRIPGNY